MVTKDKLLKRIEALEAEVKALKETLAFRMSHNPAETFDEIWNRVVDFAKKR